VDFFNHIFRRQTSSSCHLKRGIGQEQAQPFRTIGVEKPCTILIALLQDFEER
jgi:hypothetical protein